MINNFIMAKKLVVISILLFLLISAAVYPITGLQITHQNRLKMHSSIAIDGNADFTSRNGVKSGSGTAEDPYIISNWKIKSYIKNGISVSNTDAYFVIENCHIDGCKILGNLDVKKTFGIVLSNVTNGRIVNCSCYNFRSSFGIVIMASSNNTVENCRGYDNDVGLTVNGCPHGGLSSSNNNIIKNCRFANCNDGIYFCCLPSSYNNVIDSCILDSNKRGVCLDHTIHYTTIVNCNISNNKEVGLEILSVSSNNHISNNVFWNNKKHAYDNCKNSWDNGPVYGGNYWSESTTSIPYKIPGMGNNKDYYPLIEKPEGKTPIALFRIQPEFPIIDREIYFDGSLSYCHGETIDSYAWDFGDDSNGTGEKISHLYQSEGAYNVTLNISVGAESDTFVKKIKIVKLNEGVIIVTPNMSIQEAVNNSKSGYDIIVESGVYYENIVVDKPYLNLIGNVSNNTVIDDRQNGHVICVTAPVVNISGFTITNSSKGFAGIQIGAPDYILDSFGCNIKNNNIHRNDVGISIYETEQNTIENNILTDNRLFGIYSIRSYHNHYERNHVIDNDVGLQFEYASNWNEIIKNTVNDNNIGIALNWSHSNAILQNNIRNNYIGVRLSNALSPKINYNNICGNDEYGLVFTGNLKNAKHNWWGSKLGPSWMIPIFGDKIVGHTEKGRLQIISRNKRMLACFPWEKEPVII